MPARMNKGGVAARKEWRTHKPFLTNKLREVNNLVRKEVVKPATNGRPVPEGPEAGEKTALAGERATGAQAVENVKVSAGQEEWVVGNGRPGPVMTIVGRKRRAKYLR